MMVVGPHPARGVERVTHGWRSLCGLSVGFDRPKFKVSHHVPFPDTLIVLVSLELQNVPTNETVI